MTHSSKWLLTLGVSVVACGIMTCLYAQDDLEALLQDLGGQQKKPAAAAAKPAAPAKAEKAVEPAPAPAVEKAPAAAEQAKTEEKAVPAEKEKPAETKPAEPAPAPVAEKAPAADGGKPSEAVLADQPKNVGTAAAPAAKNDQSNIISELMTLETIRRKSLDDHGYASLETARKAMTDGDYVLAREQYKQALEFIGNRPATKPARDEARTGMGEAFYREAKQAMKKGNTEAALPLAAQAKEYGHPQADRLIEALKKEPPKTAADNTSISHRLDEEAYKTQRDEIRQRLRHARQYFTTAEYDKALEECELVLRDYPSNTEAMDLRKKIGDRLQTVSSTEFEATHSMMISEVRKTWTPDRYAIESSQMPKGKNEMTGKTSTVGITDTKTAEQLVRQKLVDIIIPEVNFRPPATIVDAVDFFKQASRDYDKPEIPVEQRGVNLVLKLATNPAPAPAAAQGDNADPFAAAAAPSAAASGVPQISALSARFISLYDALKLVCDVTGMKFRIRGNIVMIVPANEPDAELITRSYNVLSSLTERKNAAQSEMNQSKSSSGDNTFMQTTDMSQKEDWKVFFQQMGVQWPDGSSISYLATIGKLRVTNTAENLAVFEQVLEDLNVTPRLIEIEARFVEVSQEDLNSLGFEWLLNNDYNFTVGGTLGRALGLRDVTTADSTGSQLVPLTDANGNNLYGANGQQLFTSASSLHNTSVSAVDGSTYSTGMRYLNTTGNAISGEGESTNDQFMKVNAFLGSADVSMILHMLSQRSDTDLLSAPKVVTKSGQEAIMKVVTEYIYPTEFEVQISDISGSSGSSGSNVSADPIGIVEPQNFEMREVGVILQVVPEVSAEGQMINLVLNPQVVSEPVWKNYGTKIPKTTYEPVSVGGVMQYSVATTTYTELPMEQPFFHVRSVQTQLSVYNGATVVMGGLITEDRKTMEDKIPFLGDLPYIGRLFRSRSEESTKRNLLVFVTARLVDPAGRVVRTGGESPLMSGAGAGTGQAKPVTTSGTAAGGASAAPVAADPAAAPAAAK